MKTGVSGIQWENENSLRKYPLYEGATCVDDSGNVFGTGMILDASVTSTVALENLRISSVYAGEKILSVALADDLGPVAHATLVFPSSTADIVFDSERPGVVVTMKISADSVRDGKSYRFSSFTQSGIHPFCIVEIPGVCVSKVVDDTTGHEAAGDITVSFESDVTVRRADSKDTTGVVVEPSKSVTRNLAGGCSVTDLNTACVVPVIQSINGVKPNENGSIAIIFE